MKVMEDKFELLRRSGLRDGLLGFIRLVLFLKRRALNEDKVFVNVCSNVRGLTLLEGSVFLRFYFCYILSFMEI